MLKYMLISCVGAVPFMVQNIKVVQPNRSARNLTGYKSAFCTTFVTSLWTDYSQLNGGF